LLFSKLKILILSNSQRTIQRRCGAFPKFKTDDFMDLDKLLEEVDSKESFFHFVEALKKDKVDEEQKEAINPSSPYSSGANGWENGTIVNYLDALHAFGNDSSSIELSWKSFALLLYSGKFYE
jgi:hypothetical protein